MIGPYEENTIVKDDVFNVLMNVPDHSFDLIVSSPPYFNAKEYAQWETYAAYKEWLGLLFIELSRTLKNGKRLCWNVCDYALKTDAGTFAVPISADSIAAALAAGLQLRHWIIWSDPAALARRHPTGTFPSGPSVVIKHTVEFVIVFQKPRNGETPRYGKLPPELEPYNQMGKAFFSERVANQIWSIKRESNNVHPAVYPEALAEPLIRMWTRPQDIVFDPFSGSGTTAVSAMTWRRRFFGVERNDLYHEYSIERLNVRGRAISCSEMMGDLFDLESDLYTDREVKARQLVLNGG